MVEVSIPRSGFCLFILEAIREKLKRSRRFNPSVGILFVHTRRMGRRGVACDAFQSLGRDSVCSYPTNRSSAGTGRRVSIPRSGFCLFIRHKMYDAIVRGKVSIPRSGFCLFILAQASGYTVPVTEFQSLGRDSVCSYPA